MGKNYLDQKMNYDLLIKEGVTELIQLEKQQWTCYL